MKTSKASIHAAIRPRVIRERKHPVREQCHAYSYGLLNNEAPFLLHVTLKGQSSWTDEKWRYACFKMYDYTVDLYTWPGIMRKHETSAIGNIPLNGSKNKGASRYDDEITSANGK